MGEARRRGTFEKRMTEAQAYGRKKKPKVKASKVDPFAGSNQMFMAAIFAMQGLRRKR